jgi:site-specific DNA-cytosine methylase
MTLNVLDLFSGLGGWSQAFVAATLVKEVYK